MKRIQKILLAFAIVVFIGASASAQIYVDIRPSIPVVVRPVAPAPGYIWIEEDWYDVGGRYEWRGGYWAPPRTGYYYRPGYWRTTNRGQIWTGGRWAPRGQGANYGPRGNGHYKGHGHGHGKGHGHHKH